MPGLHLLRQEQHCDKQRMSTAKAPGGHKLKPLDVLGDLREKTFVHGMMEKIPAPLKSVCHSVSHTKTEDYTVGQQM